MRGAAWLWVRQEGISVLVFPPMALYFLAFSQNSSCTTQGVFRHFTHVQNFCTVLFDRTIANWICDCQHSSCVLERPNSLETCSVEMQSSVLGRHAQLCTEKVLWWGLLSSMCPELAVLGWRKVILQHRSTLQCPLPSQVFWRGIFAISVGLVQYSCIHLKLDLAHNVLHEHENCTWHLAAFSVFEKLI